MSDLTLHIISWSIPMRLFACQCCSSGITRNIISSELSVLQGEQVHLIVKERPATCCSAVLKVR